MSLAPNWQHPMHQLEISSFPSSHQDESHHGKYPYIPGDDIIIPPCQHFLHVFDTLMFEKWPEMTFKNGEHGNLHTFSSLSQSAEHDLQFLLTAFSSRVRRNT